MRLEYILYFSVCLSLQIEGITSALSRKHEKQHRRETVLRVGPGQPYRLPSAAARVAEDGDTIEILAGTYPCDVAVWTQNNLTIRGVHGRPHLKAEGRHAEGKAIWVIKGNSTTIENIEFSGCRVPDRNGAGIRQEGAGLTIRNCYFHDNEMGILTGRNTESEVLIETSEFAANYVRTGSGSIGHNIYIGNIKKFTLRGCYVHGAQVGHQVKSRAEYNYILYSRIADEENGGSSYLVDLPNGGLAVLLGNILHEGKQSENYHLVSFGAEGVSHMRSELYVVNNTFLSDRRQAVFVRVAQGAKPALVINNIFVGNGDILHGPGTTEANFVAGEGIFGFFKKSPEFVDAPNFDFRLKASSPLIDRARDPGFAGAFSLIPTAHYVHKAQIQPRPKNGPLDIGAYEFFDTTSAK